ncbi:MAG: 3'(2'), 5'-bisphosphate nucleotidase [Myxococcota bacterium]|jgi:3'(2'), 5'-bisphosphate nucleotidase
MSSQLDRTVFDDPMIAEVERIAARAATLIMGAFGASDLAVRTKSDDSPQSRADREASDLITTALRAAFGEPVISEEQRVSWAKRREWTVLWLVDPLDGSREFLNGIEEFAVSIGRIEAGAPTHGVIYIPPTGVCYAAISGAGAAVRRGGRITALPAIVPPRPIQALSRYHNVPAAAEFADLNGYTEMRPTGSALKFGMLAEGEIAVYPRFEECKEWDTAAGQLILTEAGGAMIDVTTGHPPIYNKPAYPNNSFVACAPGIDITTLRLPASAYPA